MHCFVETELKLGTELTEGEGLQVFRIVEFFFHRLNDVPIVFISLDSGDQSVEICISGVISRRDWPFFISRNRETFPCLYFTKSGTSNKLVDLNNHLTMHVEEIFSR